MNSERPTDSMDTPDDDTELRALLAPLADVLGSDAVWAEPPPGLGEVVVERVRRAARPESDGPAADTSTVVPLTAARSRPPRWAALAAAAAAAVAAFGVGMLVADGDGDSDDVAAIADVDLTGTALAPDARARGDVVDRGAGYAIRLDVAGLAPAAEGEFYEGWLRADDGEMVSIGTFHMRSGDSPVVLWSGVLIADYDTVIVTEEQERAGAESSDRIVLEGAIDPRGTDGGTDGGPDGGTDE